MLFFDNLYEKIIRTESKHSFELRIISGYGSASFLRRVKEEFPHLKISLFLGMTFQGVSEKDHKGFVKINKDFEDVKVYYEIDGLATHTKLVEFISEKGKKIYIGSANFTDNGFFHQREIMALVNDSTKELFDYQKSISMLCVDKDIEKYINIYPNNSIFVADFPETYIEELRNSENGKESNRNMTDQQFLVKLTDLRQNINPKYYTKFDIEVVLEEKNNPRWADSGINAWIDKKKPSLIQTPRMLFDKVFPENKVFEIYSDDGNIYLAKLVGRFNGNLVLTNGDFYEYVRKKINLEKKRPISFEDLQKYGSTKIHFERLEELKYYMYFNAYDQINYLNIIED